MEEDFWDEEGTTAKFTEEDFQVVYGGKNRGPKVSEQPSLVKATVNFKVFWQSRVVGVERCT
jgi:hypothetical protein